MLKAVSDANLKVSNSLSVFFGRGIDGEKRVVALDFARFVAMLMMIQGHVIYALGDPAVFDISVFPWNFWHFMRGFTAPVFLMVSGAANVFANKRDENGKLLNRVAFRRIRLALILMLIGYMFAFPANRFTDIFFIEAKYWDNFLRVNILQLIGISLIMMMGLFKITRNDKQLGISSFVIAVLITILGPALHHDQTMSFLPAVFANYFSFEGGSLFPIFPYTAFMFYGIFFGTLLKKFGGENKTAFIIKKGSLISLIMLAISIPGYFYLKQFPYFYEISTKVNPAFIMMQIGYVFLGVVFLSAVYLFTRNYAKFYKLFGKRALHIYVLHLIFIYGTPWFPSIAKLYPRELDLFSTIGFVILIEAMTLGTIYLYEYYSQKAPKVKKISKISISALIGFFITVGSPIFLF
jgi:uncharacterized membrane protein